MGATDVVPFIPIKDITMDECVKLARNWGRRSAKSYLSLFIYMKRRRFARSGKPCQSAAGQYEGLKKPSPFRSESPISGHPRYILLLGPQQ